METFSAEQEKIETQLLEASSAIDAFEGYSQPHALRITELADSIAQRFRLADHDRFCLRQSALLHDVGEMVMDRGYIRSSNPLVDSERVDMERHPVIGEQEASRRGMSRSVQLYIRWHHEWWDGSGYPDALRGEEIPLAARILRIADTYVSMTCGRPFRAAHSHDAAKEYVRESAGIEFDPEIVLAFLAVADTPRARSAESGS